ncbi:MAG: hypothetical protein AABW73_01600 [Nanoarchaeota archaeon]
MVVILSLLTGLVLASSEIVVHVDSSGKSTFLGSSDSDVPLPLGVTSIDGKVRGISYDLTSKVGSVWNFSLSIDNSEIQVFLPRNVIIKSTNGEVSTSVRNIVVYSQGSVQITYVFDDEKTFLLLIIIISALIIISLSYYYFSKGKVFLKPVNNRRLTRDKKISIIEPTLNSSERLLIGIIKDKKRISSSYLRILSSIPKSSFFRVLQELEKKGLIVRKGEGKNKIIELA